jgi:hypothetical protein
MHYNFWHFYEETCCGGGKILTGNPRGNPCPFTTENRGPPLSVFISMIDSDERTCEDGNKLPEGFQYPDMPCDSRNIIVLHGEIGVKIAGNRMSIYVEFN